MRVASHGFWQRTPANSTIWCWPTRRRLTRARARSTPGRRDPVQHQYQPMLVVAGLLAAGPNMPGRPQPGCVVKRPGTDADYAAARQSINLTRTLGAHEARVETGSNPRSPRDRDDGFRLNSRVRLLAERPTVRAPLSLRHRIDLAMRWKGLTDRCRRKRAKAWQNATVAGSRSA